MDIMEQTAVSDNIQQQEIATFASVMRVLRLRRKIFFLTVLLYMPFMWGVHRITPSFRSMSIAFACWVVVLFITALYAAVAKCPRCGHYFHMHGMSLLFLRRCLHCQLHVTAKNPSPAS